MNRIQKKGYLLSSCMTLLLIINGCGGENREDKTRENTAITQTSQTKTPTIEISQNTNAKEIKVAEKKRDQSQSKSYYYDYNIKSEYNQNARPANEDAAVRVKPRTSVDANIQIRSPYENVQVSLLVKKLSKNFKIKCSACHDDYANGIIGPSLLSRDSDYIYNKIAEFKSGKKSNPLMDDLIHMMNDEEIRSLADEIDAFNKEIKKMREKK